jgi:predicted metal-binding membrane protein
MDAVLRQLSSRPRLILWVCLAALMGLSVGWLAAMAGGVSSLPSILRTLCAPVTAGESGFPAALAMWSAMILAMMLPVAFPMLSTYLDIAEAARAKSIAVVPPFVLVSGYLSAWLAFAVTATMVRTFAAPAAASAASPWLASGLFILAGLYQFSPLKQACLRKCRHPMPYFLANWTERSLGVFRMGLGQGMSCIGCCWAIMLLAFAAGTMNLAWMAFIGAMMILEKVLREPRALVSGLGLGLAGAGVMMLIVR